MKTFPRFLITVAAVLTALTTGSLAATAEVGRAAPDFTLTDINGNKYSLSALKGKTVVLEWVNPECPFVKKHYNGSGNLPKTQKAATAEGVVWLSINSGHSGAQGDYPKPQVEAWMKSVSFAATAYCRDPDGKVGKLYDARTTPHLYVIDGGGTLVYAGGIDDVRSANPADIAKATNFVAAALADLKAGRPLRTATSKPYGCSVKYAD